MMCVNHPLSSSAVYCGAVPGVENGYVVNTTSVLFGGVVLYKCFEGFTLEGSAELTCISNGTWTAGSLPACKGTQSTWMVVC